MTPNQSDPLVGKTFSNRYRIDSLVARSSMAVVYRAVDVENKTDVAIKIINEDLLGDNEALQRFHREAQIGRTLIHPNICSLFDYGVTAEGTPYVVMEFLKGLDMEAVLEECGRLEVCQAVELMIKLCKAVQYLHARGVLHRDLKPGNLMVIEKGDELSIKVIDFGVAKSNDGGGADKQAQLTKVGEVYGSLLYVPPERFLGQPADERSEVYSIGCMIYEITTGKSPFAADTPSEIVNKQLEHKPDPLQLHPGHVRLLDPILAKALAKNPADRYQSVVDLSNALEEALPSLRQVSASLNQQARVVQKPKKSGGFFQTASKLMLMLVGAAILMWIGFQAFLKLAERGLFR